MIQVHATTSQQLKPPSGALIVIQSLAKIIHINVFYGVLLMRLCQKYLLIANSHVQSGTGNTQFVCLSGLVCHFSKQHPTSSPVLNVVDLASYTQAVTWGYLGG